MQETYGDSRINFYDGSIQCKHKLLDEFKYTSFKLFSICRYMELPTVFSVVLE